MPRYKLTLAYDGTEFCGWQIQPNTLSIQVLIDKALSTTLRTQTKIHGSGRTDTGVHARGQTAHFDAAKPLEIRKVAHSLNGLLPPAIRVTRLEEVESSFHARFSAKGKIYHYNFQLHGAQDPFQRLYAYKLPYPIDLALLKHACHLFHGTHDFTSFSNEANQGSAAQNPIRTITALQLHKFEGTYTLIFEGNGFLYKMVRNITGTLFDVARGKMPIETIGPLFEAKDRTKAPATAPAKGLFLHKVIY